MTASKRQKESFTPPVSPLMPRWQQPSPQHHQHHHQHQQFFLLDDTSPPEHSIRSTIRRPKSIGDAARLSSAKPPVVPRAIVEKAFAQWDLDGDGRIRLDDLFVSAAHGGTLITFWLFLS